MKFNAALRAFDHVGSTLLGQVAQLRTLALRMRGRDSRLVTADEGDLHEVRRRLAAVREVRELLQAYLRVADAALEALAGALDNAKD